LRDGARGPAHSAAAAVGSPLQRVAEVAQQVPPISDLLCLGRALAHTLGVDAGAVAGDHLHAWMPAKPGGDRLGAAVGQQIDHPLALEVADDGAVALAAPPRPIVDANHPR